MTGRAKVVMDRIRWVAVAAGVLLCGWLEWHAAVASGIHPYVAVCLPILIHIYVVTTILAGRDVPLALGVMWMSVVMGVTVVSAGWVDGEAPLWARATVAVWLGTVVAVVLWRIDVAVRESAKAPVAAAEVPVAEPPEAAPSPAPTSIPRVPQKPIVKANGHDKRAVDVAAEIRSGLDPSINSLTKRYGVGWSTAKKLHDEARALAGVAS